MVRIPHKQVKCLSDSMDLSTDDEVTAINGSNLQSKEAQYSSNPNSSNVLELNELVMPDGCENRKNSSGFSVDTLVAHNVDRIIASEHASASPRCLDDSELMLEELTLKNYNSENIVVVTTPTAKNRDKVQIRQNKWQHLYQLTGGSGNGGSHGDAAYGVNSTDMFNVREDVGFSSNPEPWCQNPPINSLSEGVENLQSNMNKPVPSNGLVSSGGIRTKILSKSGFSEYFVKNNLKGKGVICRGPARERQGVELRKQTHVKAPGDTKVDSGVLLRSSKETVVLSSHDTPKHFTGFCPNAFPDGVGLREWLKTGKNKLNKVKGLQIFKQIVDMVNDTHSRGVALPELRPSYFKLLPSNEIMYLGPSVQREVEKLRDQNIHHMENDRSEKRPLEQSNLHLVSQWAKRRKPGENTNSARRWPQFPSRSGVAIANETNINIIGAQISWNEFNEEFDCTKEQKTLSDSIRLQMSDSSKSLSTCASDSSEAKWYASPEELDGKRYTLSSNIYCLGVLLFELMCSFDSERAHAVAMFNLRHRILPSSFLSESPKEAGFCLWLLHPEPSSRPTTREILQSKVISGIQDLSRKDLSSSINQEDAESELLLHFLESLKEKKNKNFSKLVEEIEVLETDIEEVGKRQMKNSQFLSPLPDESLNARRNIGSHRDNPSSKVNFDTSSACESRLMRNINQLESAYFSVRSHIHSNNLPTMRDSKELLESRESWHQQCKDGEINNPSDHLGAFFNGLCKYSRYSKFKVRGVLRNGDFNNSANVICSLSFDRDGDYFAAAGVSKKIKIYDFHALSNDSVDIHYPTAELSNESKLTCTCWNSYIKNYLASTDYEGVVKLWDAGTGQGIYQYAEHDRRAWSVDCSQLDPTKLASGSDDCSVKLWNINEKNSSCTIRNIANVCCVQFSAKSSHLIAFGSADYKIYCYDLRNISTPWCILTGHDRAVSYVKFVDSETLISASTDNTLKLWDLNRTSATGLSNSDCILTFRGHTNEKNFVGLSVADDGYIACGSETNEVFAYYKSLPMPITSYKFALIDPISGKETDDHGGQFVSSVCWRRKSDMVVAANSSGSIKLLQMI